MRWRWLAVASFGGACFTGPPAAGFSINQPDIFTTTSFEDAPRWTAEALADGIRVGVDPSFATAWSPFTTDAAVVEGWVRAAFAAWENPALQFDIRFGDTNYAEITLRAVPGADPLFGVYGRATSLFDYDPHRVLTNGQIVPGYTIYFGLISIAAERLQAVPGFAGTGIEFQGRIITRLFMHEIGHAIGLGHTNDLSSAYYDTDFDPDNAMSIDPSDPFAGLVDSPNRFVGTVMSNQPCGEFAVICLARVTAALSLDDIGGRDVLYPVLVPEPGLGVLGAIAWLGAVTARRGHESRRSR